MKLYKISENLPQVNTLIIEDNIVLERNVCKPQKPSEFNPKLGKNGI